MSERFVYPANLLKVHRSKWKAPHRWKGSFMHGDCVPFEAIEILPGDTIKLDVASLIRMSTPIAPIMDDITFHMAAYFIPNRLTFENWEELCGVNKTGAWTTGMTNVVVPRALNSSSGINLGSTANTSFHNSDYGNLTSWQYQKMCDYILGTSFIPPSIPVSLLPFRAYYLVHNYNYRSSVVSAPIPVDRSSNNTIAVGEGYSYSMCRKPEPLGKYPDIYTKCLPEPQFGSAIQFLSDLVPVHTISTSVLQSGAQDNLKFAYAADGSAYSGSGNAAISGGNFGVEAGSTNLTAYVVPSNLAADFSNQLKTINDLRYAFQLQKFLEKDARVGSNKSYREYLNAHYGVTIAEGVAQQPVFLGEFNFKINIDQVLSTAGYDASSNTTVGATGANSVTGKVNHLFTQSFSEHGILIIVGGCRHNQTYADVIPVWMTHTNKLDFYHPEFANIGEVSVPSGLLNPGAVAGLIFGYQEAWYDYRYLMPDRVIGLLNPAHTGSLDFWTLAERHSGATLSETFIYESRSAIARALVSGTAGPDYIGDLYFDYTIARAMPAYSIPGFADHH